MGIRITMPRDPLGKLMNRVYPMREVGDRLAKKIVTRSLNSLDEHGKPFKWYTPKYARWKSRFEGRPVARSAVDLWLTGKMLGSLKCTSTTRNTARIGFTNQKARDLARWTQEGKKPRRFLGIPKAWLTEEQRRLLKGE